MSTRFVSPLQGLDDCGCCEGLGARTPQGVFNRPGLDELAYRSGTHSRFLASMLARLTSADLPALQALRTRDRDDFTIALCDSWAMVADVVTFYQERIANEAYLRTARERRSILELARLIGYRLRPGVAADAMLAFALEQAPGAPKDAEAIISIEAGLPVQSVPGPDELPQTFETSASIEGRVAWNDMAVQTTEARLPGRDTQMYLQGTSTLLRPGDPILIIGDDRVGDTTSLRWDFRRLTEVVADEDNKRTLVRWADELATPPQEAVQADLRIYALRRRASLFGYNAPDPRTLRLDPATTDGVITSGSGTTLDWLGFGMPSGFIDLDAVYPDVVTGSWVVLTAGSSIALARVDNVIETTRTDYTISNRITRISPDASPSASTFQLRQTAVYAKSDELALAETPLPIPLFGDVVTLAQRVDGLVPGQWLAVRGARLKLRIAGTVADLKLEQEDGSLIDLDPGDELEVVAVPVLVAIPGVFEMSLSPDDLQIYLGPVFFFIKALWFPALEFRWGLADRDGRLGTMRGLPTDFELTGATDDSELVEEIVAIDKAPGSVSTDRDRTTLTLAAGLKHLYDRTTVRINANVAPATHGETVSEVLNSGDASRTYQRFVLKQTPLTHVTAATPSGTESTLEVRVNDILWAGRPTLFGGGPEERIYTTWLDDDGFVSVQFGDGINGARLPTGQDNVRATYRKGIGLDGLVPAGKLTQLMSRPLGLKEVTNPHAAEGAENAESRDQARENSPLTVLTLDRVVSLRDCEDFARAFAGIAKAHAAWVWDRDGNSVLITVSGPNGAEIRDSSQVYADLLAALSAAGDPTVRYRVKTYRPALFRFAGSIVADPDFIAERVRADVEAALRSAFAFERRAFTQPTTLSEVIAVIQATDGVVAVDVDALYRGTTPALSPRLMAEPPEVTPSGDILAAELLTLDPAPLDKLEVLP